MSAEREAEPFTPAQQLRVNALVARARREGREQVLGRASDESGIPKSVLVALLDDIITRIGALEAK